MPAAPLPRTLGELRISNQFNEARLKSRSVKDEMRDNLMARLKARETVFPGIVGLRGHGDPADCECRAVEAEFHSAGAARPGEEPHSARFDGAARRADAVCGGMRNPRQSLPAAVRALPRPDCRAGRRDADRVDRARRPLRGEAGHAGRDGRRSDWRSRSDQGGARRERIFRAS